MKLETLILFIRSVCPEYLSGCPSPDIRQELAHVVIAESRSAHQDAMIVAAVIAHESKFKQKAKGRKGEVGLMQIKPDGVAAFTCRDLLAGLWQIAFNIRCGIRVMLRARRVCGKDAPALEWLGIYNGVRKCVPSRYARSVLGLLQSRYLVS
jgi:hypothetical protein